MVQTLVVDKMETKAGPSILKKERSPPQAEKEEGPSVMERETSPVPMEAVRSPNLLVD